jgi:hypothetical protein
MNRPWLLFLPCLAGQLAMSGGLPTGCDRGARRARAQEPKAHGPHVVLADTYNAVTKVHFLNVAVHKGSPNPAKRRFRADVRYWLMDARHSDRGELSIGNPLANAPGRSMLGAYRDGAPPPRPIPREQSLVARRPIRG